MKAIQATSASFKLELDKITLNLEESTLIERFKAPEKAATDNFEAQTKGQQTPSAVAEMSQKFQEIKDAVKQRNKQLVDAAR